MTNMEAIQTEKQLAAVISDLSRRLAGRNELVERLSQSLAESRKEIEDLRRELELVNAPVAVVAPDGEGSDDHD